ncbi:MAG TPA: glycoside hydrolase family 3 C-terminal domain-containing protein [Acidobacteriaceae bacterium]
MLAKMTLDEKLSLIGGNNFSTHAIPSIGLPALKMSDGPYGVRTYGRTTAYAAGIALAAAWDTEIARRTGESMGKDARARGIHFLLAPGVNIYRSPMNGRNFEYFGEDPFLAARTSVGFIEGVQSQGVVATVKHFAANNSEFNRHNLNTIIDERTLREIYLPAFEASVRDAHAGAVMDSYNLLNGEHLTQNSRMNNEILKKEWGFNGVLMSDWDATYNTIGAANGGLDLEMPFGKFMNSTALKQAMANGQVSEAIIDAKVKAILRTAIRFHFLERPQQDDTLSLYDTGGSIVAYDAALASITLLRNEHTTLPLDPAHIRTIAVIGPNAQPAVPGGGGSSEANPFSSVSFLDGIAKRLGPGINILYARGLPSPSSVFWQTHFDTLTRQVFSNTECSGAPRSTNSPNLITDWRLENWPHTQDKRCLRWTATYSPSHDGAYTMLVAAAGKDAYQLRVDGKVVLKQLRTEDQTPRSVEVRLYAGRPINVELEYIPDADIDRIGFGIQATDDLISPEVRNIAAHADAAIVCVGFDPSTEAEGKDRTYDLPFGQTALIKAVSALNPKTIVTITSGGAYATDKWLTSVPVLLQTWYSGQEGGRALATILFGHSPEGKLPISFERTWDDNPAHDNYYPQTGLPGPQPSVAYKEGLFLGYRFYTSMHKPVLFPFGFGLSYTTFRFSNLHLTPGASLDSPSAEFDITNTGKTDGTDIAQLYVGSLSSKVIRPIRELKGFQKVHLAPGQTQHIIIRLDRRAFSYYRVESKSWQADPGRYLIQIGDSSVDLPLSQEITLSE